MTKACDSINIYSSVLLDRFTCWLDCHALRWITNSHIAFFCCMQIGFNFNECVTASLSRRLWIVHSQNGINSTLFFVVRMQLELNCKFVGICSHTQHYAQFYGANGEHRGVCMWMVINYFATTMLLQGRFTLYVDWDYVRAHVDDLLLIDLYGFVGSAGLFRCF